MRLKADLYFTTFAQNCRMQPDLYNLSCTVSIKHTTNLVPRSLGTRLAHDSLAYVTYVVGLCLHDLQKLNRNFNCTIMSNVNKLAKIDTVKPCGMSASLAVQPNNSQNN